MLDHERLRRVVDVGRAVVSELDVEAVLTRVLEEARALTGARYAALGILSEDRRELERFLTIGIDADTRSAIGDLPRGRGVLGVLISDPRPLRLHDVGDHPRSYGFPIGHPPMRSFLGVPVLVRGEAFGNLYLTDKDGADAFDDDDEEAIVLLASWAGVAIANARAYEAEHQQRRELEHAVRGLEATTAIARAVGAATDLERVLELIVKRARALVEARGVLIVLRDGDELEVAAVAGELGADVRGSRMPVRGSVSGDVLLAERAERLPDVRDRLRFVLRDIDVRSGLFVPLVFRGRALGVLEAFDRADGEEFSASDESLLEAFAASAATAVATAQTVASEGLRRSIESSERERQRWARELHDGTLQQLAGLKVLLSGARRSSDRAAADAALGTALELIDDEIAGLRRLIADLRPATLDEFGLEAALEGLVERVTATSGLRVDLDATLGFESRREPGRLAAEIEDAAYRVIQEALTNVVKHAGASRVAVRVREADQELELIVADDGRGFDPAAPAAGFGLLGMRERVDLAGGHLEVTDSELGGTAVRATLPARRAAPPAQASA